MALLQAAGLKSRSVPLKRPVSRVLTPFDEAEIIARGHHRVYVFCKVFPVRGDIQCAAGVEFLRYQIEERCIHDASFVVTFFWPGVGEQQIDSRKCVIRNLMLQHIHGVVGDDTQVVDPGTTRFEQAVTNAGLVDFYAKEIEFWMVGGRLYQRIAITKTYFQNFVCAAAKNGVEVEEVQPVLDAEFWPQLFKCPLLRGRHAA